MKRHASLTRNISALLTILIPAGCLACGSNQTTIVQLPTFGGSITAVNALSAGGHLTGYSYTAGNLAAHAFLFAGGTMTDLVSSGAGDSQGLAVNSAGQVVGNLAVGEFETHAFIYSSGSLVDIGTLGGSYSVAVSINDAGQVAGSSYLAGDSSFTAFVYQNSAFTDLGTLGGSTSLARTINQAGNVAGESSIQFDSENHAFLYQSGVMTDLGTLGGGFSTALALNAAATVVGESWLPNFQTHAFVYSNGVMTDLGTLGGTYSTASAVNNAGQIIGVSSTVGDISTHGFIYAGGSMTDLGTLGGTFTGPNAINNLGQIVGVSTLANETQRAFLWQQGVMVDLNTLLPTNSGWELIAPQFINDAGRIAGYGLLNGVWQTFVMDLGVGGGNNPPTAAAGEDQVVECSVQVTLNGSLSSDPDNDVLTYEWSVNGVVFATNLMLGAVFDVGLHVVSLKVTDPCGLAATDTVTVTVVDTTVPTITCPPAVSISTSTDCQATVPDFASQVVVNDNCTQGTAVSIVQNPPAGSLVGPGQHTVTLTATDTAGNSAACSVSLTVADTTAPVILVSPAAQTVPTGENCLGVVPNITTGVTASDNCTLANQLLVNQNPPAGALLPAGQHTITVTVADAAGNVATTSMVLTVADVTAPVILAGPGAQTVPTGENCLAVVPNIKTGVTASDNCTPANQLLVSQNPPAGALLPAGQHTITVTVADAAGNVATANVVLTVADVTAPVILASPNAQTVPTGANCQGVVPNITSGVTASDNCTPANQLLVSQNPPAGALLPAGQHTITVTVADAAGNVAMTSMVLTVADLTPPNIASATASPDVLSPPNHQMVPVTVTVAASDGCDPAPMGKITAVTCNEPVSPGEIQITGDLTVNLAASKNSSGSARLYTITVQCTDASGNAATRAVSVTVPKSNNSGGGKKP